MATGLTNRAGGAYHYIQRPKDINAIYRRWDGETQNGQRLHIIQMLHKIEKMIEMLPCQNCKNLTSK